MFALFVAASSAFADPSASLVSLHVGILLEAGDLTEIAADGAAGACSWANSRVTCPANGAVQFRWAGDERWELTGTTTLQPGEMGTAFVLAAAQDPREAIFTKKSLRVDDIHDHLGPLAAPLNRALLDRLVALSEHTNPGIRRTAVQNLHSWTWGSGVGPLPTTAPVPVPEGWLVERAEDPFWGVRRELVDILRDFRDRERADEVSTAVERLTRDPDPRVQRAAIVALASVSKNGMLEPEKAWHEAMKSLAVPGARGRAAVITLSRLATELDADETIDPIAALEKILQHHPRSAWRFWAAWRNDIPFREDWAFQLFSATTPLHKGLIVHWSNTDPDGLASVLQRWESAPPHSVRFETTAGYLGKTTVSSLRRAIGLPDKVEK